MKSRASSRVMFCCGTPNLVLASLNLAPIAIASLLALCMRECGCNPSDLNMEVWIGRLIIVIILCDWWTSAEAQIQPLSWILLLCSLFTTPFSLHLFICSCEVSSVLKAFSC